MYRLIEETPIADIKVEEFDDLEYIQGRKDALESTAMGHTYRIDYIGKDVLFRR